jgi:hypothetical protein
VRLDELVSRFRGPAIPDGKGGFMVFCPAHDDGAKAKRQSLHVSWKNGRPYVHCFAGCEDTVVLAKVGLTVRDLLTTSDNGSDRPLATHTYDYADEKGVLLFRVVRREFADGHKTFAQCRPDGHGGWIWNLDGVRRVLYRLRELKAETRRSKLPKGWAFIVEGDKLADRLRGLGLPATTNAGGAGKWLPEFWDQLLWAGVTDPILSRDNDPPGLKHMAHVLETGKGFDCRWLELPGVKEKGDLADWLDAGGTVDALVAMVTALPVVTTPPAPPPAPVADTAGIAPASLQDVHDVFTKWLGEDYDLEVLDAVLASAASERLTGDPLWTMVLSGSGAAKTETVQCLEGAGAHVVSVVSSVGSLLSGSSKRETSKDATGGLLRRIGARGLVVFKDFTSILSMDRTSRAGLLAALREIHDGKWVREIGTDGGRLLSWQGRIVLISACTSAWDRAHEVVATMGDRFVLVRYDSKGGRQGAFRRAVRNSGREAAMRRELAEVVRGLLSTIDPAHDLELTDEELGQFFQLANLVTLARTAVDTDYREDVVTPHAPEMPTRLGKQLWQLVRGATALGLRREDAMALAGRCAHDTVPPVRMALLATLSGFPESSCAEVSARVNLPYNTVRRQLEALRYLDLVRAKGEERNVVYWLSSAINPDCLMQFGFSTNVGGPEEESISTDVGRGIRPPPLF